LGFSLIATMSDDETLQTNDLRAVRLAKLQELRAAGHDPFAAQCSQSHTSAEAVALCPVEESEPSPAVAVAGRLMTLNVMGKATFARILDRAGSIQVYVRREAVGEEAYARFKKLDLGDFVGFSGALFRTRTGEATVRADSFTVVAKALRPPPEKWHGLADPEAIYRQRYLDLIANDESRQRFLLRSRLISRIRRFLEDRDFLEVETPILQTTPGGAAARPFTTHFNALGCDFHLRIALELYLKRLLVGGFDRVFEIGRNFRNEGLSRKHNPEFTMLELYQAYSDYRGMMELIKDLIQTLAREVVGSLTIARADGGEINLDGDWREVSYRDLVREATGDPAWFELPTEEKRRRAAALGLQPEAHWEDYEIDNDIYTKKVEPQLIQPTFVTQLPRELIPLAKLNPDDPSVVDVFELCINGQEIAPAYSEQNDPLAQRAALEAQAGEEIQKLDEDFLLALEHGMPPAGGLGLGIDRLCILLTGAASIRDVILFPSMRPRAE